MKKETINTFEKGMIKDLHPLTTPNNILTDALNATLITYNGNENILQNDMGNAEIGTAFLSKGYVPVGMKEYGGIVYVAAYNPETGKGQIGSFPSPQQLWEGENWTVNNLPEIVSPSITFDFYDGNFIKNEVLKCQLFNDSNGNARVFHPGDKFVIKFPKSNFSSAVENGYLSIQLCVLKSDGSLEVMRTWNKTSNGDFLYQGELTIDTILNNSQYRQYVQVFDASSSGELYIVFNLHTLDSFNITKTYSEDSNQIKVTFRGEGQLGDTSYISQNGNVAGCYLSLAKAQDNSIQDYDKEKIEVSGSSGSVSFDLYPNVPFGVVKKMKRPFTVNFDRIRRGGSDFGEWRFYVTPTYVKIGWSFDYYDLSGQSSIQYVQMKFFKIQDQNEDEPAAVVTFQKENYNGNFEDYINYKDTGLVYRNIYVVKIIAHVRNADVILGYRLLYLSTLYNDEYNSFYINNSIGIGGEGDQDSQQQEFGVHSDNSNEYSVNFELEHSLDTELIESKTEVQRPGESQLGNETDTAKVNQSLYTLDITKSALDAIVDDDQRQFLTQIKNKYKSKFKITAKIKGLDDKFIGIPDPTLVTNLLNNITVQSIETCVDKQWMPDTNLPNAFPDISDADDAGDEQGPEVYRDLTGTFTGTITDNVKTFDDIEFYDHRYIQGMTTDIQTLPYETKGLAPLYSPKYSLERRRKIAPYCNLENMECMSGAGDSPNELICYNSHVTMDGQIIEGIDAGGGCDDGGLSTASHLMNDPMTNIFSGDYGEDASLAFRGIYRNGINWTGNGAASNNPAEGWNVGSEAEDDGVGQILQDQGDNFLIACWKFTDNSSRFVNLISTRKPGHDSITNAQHTNSNYKWPRLDIVLRCILSQIFVVNRVAKTASYVTPDQRFYRYQKGNSKIRITLNSTAEQTNFDNILVDSAGNKITSYLESGSYWYGKDIPNLLPKVKATIPSTIDAIEIEIPDMYNIDNVLLNYLGITYKQNIIDNTYDAKTMYMIDVSQTPDNTSACALDQLKPNKDGAYEWKTLPKCIPITDNLVIYRWDDQSQITFQNFGTQFETKAELNDWTDIPEGEENEIYAKLPVKDAAGKWVDAVDENAPNMCYEVLYSPTISVLANTRSNVLF